MSLGKQILAARKAAGLTQTALAEKLDVSIEAVSKWEKDRYVPSPEKLEKLRELLGLTLYEDDGTVRDLRLFDETHMSAFLRGKLSAGAFPEASKALGYAKEMHEGMFRSPQSAGIPFISHPLTMACHALALGLEDDVLLTALLLHDVPEKCGVPALELPACDEVQDIVALVTKPKKNYNADRYYNGIAEDPKACLVKSMERCNNLSTMFSAFSQEKKARYIRETEEYFPRLLRVIKAVPEYNNAAWLLQYQMRSLLGAAKFSSST